ncbi:hypothetical protein CSOJ01_03050 [Colletotrichum sojae]|uniref:Uncharacterized protein n=1 Tax=Colletotrichum sojae TaxID=2175907 RepID=A0A8H6JNZ2_9PEZI|nr:hypothetical protein CSOJ01_03050 [Colletotrichum sojae]
MLAMVPPMRWDQRDEGTYRGTLRFRGRPGHFPGLVTSQTSQQQQQYSQVRRYLTAAADKSERVMDHRPVFRKVQWGVGDAIVPADPRSSWLAHCKCITAFTKPSGVGHYWSCRSAGTQSHRIDPTLLDRPLVTAEPPSDFENTLDITNSTGTSRNKIIMDRGRGTSVPPQEPVVTKPRQGGG